MALKFSTAYRQFRQMGVSLQDMFEGGELQVWSGTAPDSADDAASGTLLYAITLDKNTRTPETVATALLELTSGSSGSVDSITLDGYEILGESVAYNTDLPTTASDVADQINKFTNTPMKVWAYATPTTAQITLYMCPGHGDSMNGKAIVVTATTITVTVNGAEADNMGEGAGGSTAGVDSANGLTFDAPSSGVITKTGTWSGVADNSGTAGYFRLVGVNHPTKTSPEDTEPYQYPRIQGTCGLSGADMIMSTLSVSAGLTYTIDTFTLTEPESE